MLTKRVEFMDKIDRLTMNKMKAMSIRSRKPHEVKKIEESIKIIMEKKIRGVSKEHFS